MSEAVEHKVDQLVETTARLVVMQEHTTKNIDKLTRDIKDTMCAAHECDALETRVSKLEGKIETIEGVPNAIVKRALMTAVAGTVVYLLYTIGISK